MCNLYTTKMTSKYKNVAPKENVMPQQLFQEMMTLFYNKTVSQSANRENHELEVKFGTKGIKYLTKIDYDNVIRYLKTMGFTCSNTKGKSMLRIQSEYSDPNSGELILSNIRTEIEGFPAIQEYCKTNHIKKLLDNVNYKNCVRFEKKTGAFDEKTNRPVRKVNFDDFNFRVSYSVETEISAFSGKQAFAIISNWEKSKKEFRYINRVTFEHPDFPVLVDLSIVKTSSPDEKDRYRFKRSYTTSESNVFNNPPIYEIELEINNSKIGPGQQVFNNPDKILESLRKCIKYVLCGLQSTNYPVSYKEQREILQDYMKLIHAEKYEPDKRVKPGNFIGPSSLTLQMQNISETSLDTNFPNIRKNFVVTDKADGARHLMLIHSSGKIYLINTNMTVIFTGAKTKNEKLYNSLIDGELVLHNKLGEFINLYAAFDIYYYHGRDVRSSPFMNYAEDEKENRFKLMKSAMKELNAESVIEGEISPMRFSVKSFYPNSLAQSQQINIFQACGYILKKIDEGLYEYNTDGLIFTPTLFGVGSNQVGIAGEKKKITWEYSFKWKPAEFNTIDFLVQTKKETSGQDTVTPVFEDGIDTLSLTSFKQYKTLILMCGFDPKKNGNPCQDVLDDKLPEFGKSDFNREYSAVRFYPTSPSDPNGGICNVMLEADSSGEMFMKTIEGEVFEDNTIVEFSYDMERNSGWRWAPLRVRYDKTAELRAGLPNYGNAYHVANNNWQSIHNPITKEMISTGKNIGKDNDDSDVYYNRIGNSDKTRGLRDFHNKYVKMKLITSVSKRGDILIDFACGKAGDFYKWIEAQLSFVFGVDYAKDNIENKVDGACARFLKYRREYKHVPYALFVNGDSSHNIRSGAAMLNDKAVEITRAVFGTYSGNPEKLGAGVVRQLGKGANGFNVSSCQFAIHYFAANKDTFQSFLRNVSECTALNGYFIGTSYDGKLVYKMLKSKKMGEAESIYDGESKIWEIQKEYDESRFEDNITCLGYKISVYQESINKYFDEFLVNYDYLDRAMENYGFAHLTAEECKSLGLPKSSGLFSELYDNMVRDVEKNKRLANDYGKAIGMNVFEKKISFLNRYFVYKKVRNVDASTVQLESEEEEDELPVVASNTFEPEEEEEEEVTVVLKPKTTKKKNTTKKLPISLVIDEEEN